jgi:hypothetical protein
MWRSLNRRIGLFLLDRGKEFLQMLLRHPDRPAPDSNAIAGELARFYEGIGAASEICKRFATSVILNTADSPQSHWHPWIEIDPA